MTPAQPQIPRSEKLHVLLVNDDEALRAVLKDYLEFTSSLIVTGAANGKDALRLATEAKVDLVVSDLKRPDEDVEGFIATFKAAHPTVPLAILSGNPLLSPVAHHPEGQRLRHRLHQLGVAACFCCGSEIVETLPQDLLRVFLQSPPGGSRQALGDPV